MGDNSSPPPSPSSGAAGSLTYPYSLNFQSSTSVAIIIVVLGATFFFMFLFVIYIKRCNTERMDNESLTPRTGGWNRQQQIIHGLDPEILKKFPIMKFSSVVNTTRPKDAIECAVCLGVFEDSELLRLLPACGHLFHPDCIDMWLQTHSTCPLCRRSLSRDAVSGHLQRALAALTGSIWNSSSNSTSPGESTHATNPDVEAAGAELNSVPSNTNTGQILRALSRNSESFKLAAHNMEVQDVRERIRASSSSGRFGSPSLNSSSSGRFQRISSRNQTDAGMMLTPLSCGVIQHSQSYNELSTQIQSASPPSSVSVAAHCSEGEVHSERLQTIPRTMSFSSLRRSFSTSSNKALPQ